MAHPYLEQIANKGALMRPKRQSFSHISETSNSNRSSSTVNKTDLNSGNFSKIQWAVCFGKNYAKFAKEKNIWYETLNWDSCWEKYLRIASCKNIYLQYRSEDRFGATFIWPGEQGAGITIAYIQQLGQTVANFCTRRHRQSSTLSLSLSGSHPIWGITPNLSRKCFQFTETHFN